MRLCKLRLSVKRECEEINLPFSDCSRSREDRESNDSNTHVNELKNHIENTFFCGIPTSTPILSASAEKINTNKKTAAFLAYCLDSKAAKSVFGQEQYRAL